MDNQAIVRLHDWYFTENERTIVSYASMNVSSFRYETGVAALRIKSNRCNIIILPYQGQQIWRFCVEGHELTMKSIFEEPVMTQDYLGTYGGFFLHCGATAIGVPSKNDTHPLHGELPNAPYQSAYISCGTNSKGNYIKIGGCYEHKVAFNYRYSAEPQITIYENSGILDVNMQIRNLLKTPMELMYLAHINFRPIDYSELVYSTDYDSDHIKVNVNIPDHIKTDVPLDAFKDFLHKLKDAPTIHHRIDPNALYNPEVVMSIKYKADKDGLAHNLQIHPDGYSGYVSHKPSQLPRALRWIARNPDQDALGLVLPATSGNDGYLAEKAAGNFIKLDPDSCVRFDLRVGLLTPGETVQTKALIESI